MKVIWKGSHETQDGTEKVILGIPEGAEDELHIIKKAVRRGKSIGLLILPDESEIASTEEHALLQAGVKIGRQQSINAILKLDMEDKEDEVSK